MWAVVVGKVFSLLLFIFCCISANTCDDMDRTPTINKSAAIETTITAILKLFCIINIKLIIINLLTKKDSFTKAFPVMVYQRVTTHLKFKVLDQEWKEAITLQHPLTNILMIFCGFSSSTKPNHP
jgi:hypothetical protein